MKLDTINQRTNMPIHTDIQLKQLLTKMLPERLEWHNDLIEGLFKVDGPKVQDDQLLQLCWEVEATLGKLYLQYLVKLWHLTCDEVKIAGMSIDYGSPACMWNLMHATWQQRIEALAQVKEIEIV